MDVCLSIKSKKHPDEKCTSKATHDGFCSRHRNSKILFVKKVPPITSKQRIALAKIYKFWKLHGRMNSRRVHGPSTFTPQISQNDTEICTLEIISKIPLIYRFSFMDGKQNIWTFDIRFFIQLIHYGNEMKNPYTQETLDTSVVRRLQTLTESLIRQKKPVMFINDVELTPEQIWNQKVLDVFLKLNSLGYAVNLIWFENMTVNQHHSFYTSLYNMWTHDLNLTIQEKENFIPDFNSGRSPLFRWTPQIISEKINSLKTWRKVNLSLMNSFVSRAKDRTLQNCSALYVLMAMVASIPQAAEAFPWLRQDLQNFPNL